MSLAWLVVCFGILLIGVTKSGFGAGVGLLNVPLIVLAMKYTDRGSEAALGLMLPLLILGDLIAVWQYRGMFLPQRVNKPASSDRSDAGKPTTSGSAATESADGATYPGPQLIKALIPGTVAGVILGGLLLWWFHQYEQLVGALIRLEIGFECIVLVGLHWWRQARGVQTHLLPEPWRSWLTGGFAGISSTLAHAAGPIIAMYLLPLRLDRQLFVGTCALYFFLLNTAKLPAYYTSGMFAQAELGFTVKFVPLVILGALLGWWLLRRLSDKAFALIVYTVTFLLGWYLLGEGIMQLARQLG